MMGQARNGPLIAMSQDDGEDAVVWIDEALKAKAK